MLTERERYITSIDEMNDYLESIDAFHDYRIGNIHYAGTEATITVEEIIPASHISESTGLVWAFEFENIKTIQIDSDCVLGFFIFEIRIENNSIIFDCTNGCIVINAEKIRLGIPKNLDIDN